ncbi:MAG: hypothetical protein PHS49_06225 [Candidatus Gracilibacteria bacterium]|nr:hypothetical protein [Candidatus Gracilibacteria bacterium]
MQKLSIISSVLVVTVVFLYGIYTISNSNTCSGVRVFDCQKSEGGDLVSESKFAELKPVVDKYLKYCSPLITEIGDTYVADYSDCDLNITIVKDSNTVQKVLHNGIPLTNDEINDVK